jgi:hypothetical protein
MTLDDVKRRVEEIRAIAGDDERAHSYEDQLRHDVLFEIEQGAENAQDLAHEVLKTSAIEFNRWCA